MVNITASELRIWVDGGLAGKTLMGICGCEQQIDQSSHPTVIIELRKTEHVAKVPKVCQSGGRMLIAWRPTPFVDIVLCPAWGYHQRIASKVNPWLY